MAPLLKVRNWQLGRSPGATWPRTAVSSEPPPRLTAVRQCLRLRLRLCAHRQRAASATGAALRLVGAALRRPPAAPATAPRPVVRPWRPTRHASSRSPRGERAADPANLLEHASGPTLARCPLVARDEIPEERTISTDVYIVLVIAGAGHEHRPRPPPPTPPRAHTLSIRTHTHTSSNAIGQRQPDDSRDPPTTDTHTNTQTHTHTHTHTPKMK